MPNLSAFKLINFRYVIIDSLTRYPANENITNLLDTQYSDNLVQKLVNLLMDFELNLHQVI